MVVQKPLGCLPSCILERNLICNFAILACERRPEHIASSFSAWWPEAVGLLANFPNGVTADVGEQAICHQLCLLTFRYRCETLTQESLENYDLKVLLYDDY